MKRPWTRGEKWLFAAPLLFGVVAVSAKFGPEAARRALGWPQTWSTAPGSMIRSMALSANGEVIAASEMLPRKGGWARGSGAIQLWNARTAERLAPLPPVYTRDKSGFTNGFDINCLALSPDAKLIGFSRVGQNFEMHDLQQRRLLWRFSEPIGDAELSRDGQWIALFGGKNIFVVSARDGKIRSQWKSGGTANSQDLALSPDGNLVASIGPYKSGDPIELHSATDGKLMRRIPNKLTNSVAFSPDGKRLLAARSVLSYMSTDDFSSFAPLRCYDVTTGNLIWEVKSTALGGADGQHSAACDAIYSPDGQRVAAYQQRVGQIFILDGTTGAVRSKLNFGSSTPTGIFTLPALAFSPDGKRLFARGEDAVLVWDLK